jgi:hypothetical protein
MSYASLDVALPLFVVFQEKMLNELCFLKGHELVV